MPSAVLFLFHVGISAMIVNALIIFRFHAIPGKIFIAVQLFGNISDHILDEHGIFISLFRDELFIRPFQEGIYLATGRVLDDPDYVFNPEKLLKSEFHGNHAPLIMSPFVADLPRAGADGGNRDKHPDQEITFLAIVLAAEGAVIFHETPGS
jgi:hypothetical protein